MLIAQQPPKLGLNNHMLGIIRILEMFWRKFASIKKQTILKQ
jgi:hypothetical protein